MEGHVALQEAAKDPQRLQSLINFACRWRPEILQLVYYRLAADGSGGLTPLASLQRPTPGEQQNPLLYSAIKANRRIVKRRYHDVEPHLAVYAPFPAKGGPAGVIHLRLSPNQLMARVRADEQTLVNVWLMVGVVTIVILTIGVRLLIIGRVEALTHAAEERTPEEVERLGASRGRDEIGRLAQQINHLLRSVLTRNVVWERLYRASVLEEGAMSVEERADIEDEVVLAARDRLERELEIANRIQRSLLPEKLPDNHGLSFAVRYAPAGQVGGDLYDFVVLDDNLLGIMIADVAGHGIPAAFVAGMTKIAFAQFSFQNSSPSSVVTAINDYLFTHLRTGHYVTVFYGIFDRASRKFRFVRAGHQTPFVLRKQTNILEMLETGGPLIGAATKVKFEENEITLQPGDKIIMLTDGLAECKSEQGLRLGQQGIRNMLAQLGDRNAEAIAAEIYRKSADFRGSTPPEDDITILVAEVAG